MPAQSSGPHLSWLLLALVMGVLISVVLYNLRERRRLPKARIEPSEQPDPQDSSWQDARRRDPDLDSDQDPDRDPDPDSDLGLEQRAAEEQPVFQPPFTALARLFDGPGVALLPGFERAAGAVVRAGNKSAAVRILRSDSGEVLGVEVGMVLANRLGPLTLADYDAWLAQLSALEQLLSHREERTVPSFAELHAQSREAERRLNGLDGQMVLHVLASSPSDARLSQWAFGRGLHQRAERHFSRMVGDRVARTDRVAYTISSADGGRAVSCVLDLPRTPHPERAYRSMVEDLIDAAETFGGPVVDESNRPLVEEDFGLIERQLLERMEDLRAAGIEPGGWLARALYV